MVDRSSRPHHCPNQTHRRVEKKIKHLRTKKQIGPAQIAGRLGMHASTVYRVITRLGLPRLVLLDQATGELIRREKPVRYERAAPGNLVDVDIKNSTTSPTAAGGESMAARTANRTAQPTATRPDHARSTVARTWAMPTSTTP